MKKQYRADSKLEARIALILMKAGVIGPDIDECLLWAFGPNALYEPIYPVWYERWHKLHPEFPAKKEMSFVEWMYVVGKLFVAWKNIQHQHNRKFGEHNLN